MPISRPARRVLTTTRLTEDERARLNALCAERNVTLSWALREGLRLYIADAKAAREPEAPPLFPESSDPAS